ncbi:hypothetical protein ACOMHN_066278 [Nucella lapillus]
MSGRGPEQRPSSACRVLKERRDMVTRAAEEGMSNLVLFALDEWPQGKGADVNKSTPLRVAVFSGHVTVVKCLLEHGANVNGVNSKGHSVLMNSCQKGPQFTDIVRILLENGVDVNYVDPRRGETALHTAAWGGALETGKLLIKNGATISRNKREETPLIVAALERNDHFVDFLLDTSDFSRDDQADALELLGTSHWLEDNSARCLELWERAMKLRHVPKKPVAEKREAAKTVAAYGHAEEWQTPQSLQRLTKGSSSSGPTTSMSVQCLLTRERVLGPENPDTTHIIKYAAGFHADDQEHTQAIHLLLHALDNIKTLFPFHSHTLGVYRLLLCVMADSEEEEKQHIPFPLLLDPFTHAISDFLRGDEAARKKEKYETCWETRQNLLKIVLHMIYYLLEQVRRQRATLAEEEEFTLAVKSLVKNGVRGEGENTLLHMACDGDSTHFDMRDMPYDACGFPSVSVVRALLEAGCDVTARNEAGQTALQALRKEKGGNAEIIRLLMEAGSA